jgi:threonine synthase
LIARLQCIACGGTGDVTQVVYTCRSCGGLLDVAYEGQPGAAAELRALFRQRRTSDVELDRSGVWRFRELLPFAAEQHSVTLAEGNTPLWDVSGAARWAGVERLSVKHLGMNPTGSFKDTGMAAGITQAVAVGAGVVVCASTGNTSASMAAYASRAGLRAVVLIPEGQLAFGKLAQALDYGALTLQIEGGFDKALELVRELSAVAPVYLLNSINAFRIEGQKTVAFELAEQLGWQAPDWVVVPGGNLGNVTALGKGFGELRRWGLIDRPPRFTVVQAAGAAPLANAWRDGATELVPVANARTLATAIKIGAPVSWPKALRVVRESGGEVVAVSEDEIATAKAVLGRDGVGCEPASAATLAGLRRVIEAHPERRGERIVCVLTGLGLKDPDYSVRYHQGELAFEGRPVRAELANAPRRVGASAMEIAAAMGI